MAFHRLPQSAALLKQKMKITLGSGTSFDLEFADLNKVVWKSGKERGTDWCEVVELAPQTYFIDMTFVYQPCQLQTFIVNTETRRLLAIRTIMREGDVGKEPRAVHQFSPGVLGDPAIPPAGRKPAPTRDLIGLRALYTYNPNQCFEHIYLNSQRYVWHCVVGPLRGEADVDFHTTYKFVDNQYIFCFRDSGCPSPLCFSITGIRCEKQANSLQLVKTDPWPIRLPALSSKSCR